MRNKGAVAIVLTVFGTSILFVTAHLRAHASKVKERNYETERIASSLDFSRYPKERQHNDIFDKVDCAFWFGDLNYRNTCDRQTAEDSISRDDLQPLLECDQLTQQVREKQTLTGFTEAPISFPPTFKFDPGTCNYDTSTKQRVPSWTDRILFRSSEDAITNKSYHYCPSLMSSDHRPVFGVYLVTLKPSPISQTIRAASGWFDKRAYAQGMKRRQYVQRTRSSSTKEHHMKQPSLIMKAVNGPAKSIGLTRFSRENCGQSIGLTDLTALSLGESNGVWRRHTGYSIGLTHSRFSQISESENCGQSIGLTDLSYRAARLIFTYCFSD
eukprot:sb/3466714/